MPTQTRSRTAPRFSRTATPAATPRRSGIPGGLGRRRQPPKRSGPQKAMDALASALQKITGGINQIPQRDLRQVSAASALCIAPAIGGVSLRTLTATHPSLEQRLEQLARIQAELSRPSA